MKASELMIGDWYYDKELQKKRQFHQLQFAEDYGNPTYHLDLEPIYLTKEILFANGFERTGCKGVLSHNKHNIKVFYEIDHFEGADRIVKEWSVLGIMGIEFVHEFQHYLRLVNYTELADNFKIND